MFRRVLVLFALLATPLATRAPVSAEPLPGPDPVPSSIGAVLIVEPGRSLDRLADAAAHAAGVPRDEIVILDELGAVSVPGADPASLDHLPGVATAEPDALARALAPVVPNDPLRSFQWGLTVAGVDQAWARTTGSDQVVVAVVDSGVSVVSDLEGALLPGYDFVNQDADPSDDNGHGTQSASVVASRGNNGAGIAGVCWSCKILPVKVLGADGSGSYSAVAQGIVYAADQGAEIINLSLGGTVPSALIDEAVAYARAAGSLVVAAAGNNGLDQAFYPAASPGALSIAGHDDAGARFSWSNFGTSRVDLAAPGCNPAQAPDGGYYWYCGTSSAAPFASGVAALALAANPSVSDAQLFSALTATAAPNDFTRSGTLDAEALLFESPLLDPTAPTVSFTAPLPGRTLSGQVTAAASPSDAVSLARADLFVGSTFVGSRTSAPWELSFDASDHPAGPTVLKWRVHDRAGNVGVVERTVILDNAAPTVSFLAPFPSQHLRGTVTVQASPQDDAGIARVELWVGSTRLATSTAAPWSLPLDTLTLPEGPVTLRLRAIDRVGNVGVRERTVAVDRTAPTASVGWPNPGRLVRGTVGVQTSISDNAQVDETALLANGVVVATQQGSPSTITWNTAGYAGRVELVLRVTDRAKNRTFSPARVVTVDNTAPSIALSSPAPGASISGVVTVSGTATDLSGIARVELWVGSQFVTSSTAAEFALELDTAQFAGASSIRVVAIDMVGNRRPFTRSVSFP